MSPATLFDKTTYSRPLPRRKSRRVGWIGIDIGSSCIKIAQAVHHKQNWEVLQTRVVPFQFDTTSSDSDRFVSKVEDALNGADLRVSGFVGRNAACTLSLSRMELGAYEFPDGSDTELNLMIEQELDSDPRLGREPREFGFWRIPWSTGGRRESTSIAVVSVERHLASATAEALTRSRLVCRVLDGLPFALARAVQLVSEDDFTGAEAAIDWGAESPLFTLVVDGHPVFSRPLRNRGMNHVRDAICQRLDITPRECSELLTTYGIDVTASGASNSVRGVLTQLGTAALHEFMQEIQKTLAFIRQQHADAFPNRIWLFGGGATLRNVPEWIQSMLGIETRAWSLASEAGGMGRQHPALFGTAIALSILGATS